MRGKKDGRKAPWVKELRELPGDGEFSAREIYEFLNSRGIGPKRKSSLMQSLTRWVAEGILPEPLGSNEKRWNASSIRALAREENDLKPLMGWLETPIPLTDLKKMLRQGDLYEFRGALQKLEDWARKGLDATQNLGEGFRKNSDFELIKSRLTKR